VSGRPKGFARLLATTTRSRTRQVDRSSPESKPESGGQNGEAVARIHDTDGKGPYLEAANEGYMRLRLKEGQIVGVVVYSGREHR